MISCRLIAVFLTLAVAVTATAEIIPFDSGQWVLYNAEVVEHLGRPALLGSAYLPQANFTSGVIEYDLAVTGARGYPGVTFRATSQQEYESFYCRPHVPDRPDALQYTPVFGGVSGWQLYNGDGFTAPAPIPAGEWIHVRLEIAGPRARVFFGDAETPALVMDQLKHEAQAGAVGIKSARQPTAFFSNFSVEPRDDLDLGPVLDPPAARRGLVTQWDLSPSVLPTDLNLDVYPGADQLAAWDWITADAEPGGLLDIARHRPRHGGGQASVVFARAMLHADQAETRQFSLGYSDRVRVFLNGRPLFTGDSSYRSRDETFSGIIGLYDTLDLPLEAGANELLLAVMESFGGWGVMGQDNGADLLAPGLSQVWQHTSGHRIPESVLHDPQRDVLYVTQYFRGGNECIARLSLEGEVLDREWVTGLMRPTGMTLHDGSLWVVDRRHLVRIDPDSGEVQARHEVPGARFPNDVAFDDQGFGYVSDTEGSCIFRLEQGELVRWFEGGDVSRPNGLLVQGDRLLYGNSGDGCLKSRSLSDDEVSVLVRFGRGAIVDGIRPDGRGGVLVSDFNGRLVRVDRAGEVSEVLDTTSSGAFCADFEYLPGPGLLVVPGLYDNRVTAYRWSQP